MKIIDKNTHEYLKDKINFIDKSGRFVGFELGQQCCENAFWFIADRKYRKKELEIIINERTSQTFQENSYCKNYDNYYFDDTYFFKSHSDISVAVFRLFNDTITTSNDELFLHLVNFQNGFYGHGFIFCDDDFSVIKKGIL